MFKPFRTKSLLTIMLVLFQFLSVALLRNHDAIQGIDFENTVTLNQYEYHIVSVNASQGQLLSGDWQAFPADLITAPFLVFIIDSANLVIWEASSNLTQAVDRFPANKLLYLYDPLFRIDDFPGDNYRTDSFQVKVPTNGTWHLVMYAGFTPIPLVFSWNIDVFAGLLYDIVMYSLVGVFLAVVITVFTIKVVKDKRQSEEDYMNKIIQEEREAAEKEEQEKTSLEENNEEYIEY
ncbi:MAG: hypothetical protein FK733_15210 [Asgard group archaeon]|nr:hypothetical protein [Asgard group archaeon]